MTKLLEYKEYLGSVEVDVEGECIYGRLLFIRDLISYSSDTIGGIQKAFEEAVEDYIEDCIESGDKPDVPCKGSFNVRTGSTLHREVAVAAMLQGVKLNDFVTQALRSAVREAAAPAVNYIENHTHYHGQVEQSYPALVSGSSSTVISKRVAHVRSTH